MHLFSCADRRPLRFPTIALSRSLDNDNAHMRPTSNKKTTEKESDLWLYLDGFGHLPVSIMNIWLKKPSAYDSRILKCIGSMTMTVRSGQTERIHEHKLFREMLLKLKVATAPSTTPAIAVKASLKHYSKRWILLSHK